MLIRDVFFGLRGVFGPSQIYMTDHDTLGHKLAAYLEDFNCTTFAHWRSLI